MSIEQYKKEYTEVFIPEKYLQEYYAKGPDAEVDFIISFITKIHKDFDLNDLLVMEFGGGPALYAVAAMTPFAKEIHFSDYLSANLQTVSNWVNHTSGCFDWSAYIKLALEKGGYPSDLTSIHSRTNEMREKITQIMSCNAVKKEPIENSSLKYDFVSALYCTDIAASTVGEWYEVMKNISTLIKPGGWLMLGLTQGMKENIFTYKKENITIPCADMSTEEIIRGYNLAGFDITTFFMEKRKAIDIREYKDVLMMIAKKLV